MIDFAAVFAEFGCDAAVAVTAAVVAYDLADLVSQLCVFVALSEAF